MSELLQPTPIEVTKQGFRVDSLVTIARQPSNQIAQVAGEVGFIEELLRNSAGEEFASFQGLKLDGSFSGCGAVPTDCLEAMADPQWVRAKQLYEERMAVYQAESDKYQKIYNRGIAKIAKKHGLSEEKIREIEKDLHQLDP